jgi:hypothetical protein
MGVQVFRRTPQSIVLIRTATGWTVESGGPINTGFGPEVSDAMVLKYYRDKHPGVDVRVESTGRRSAS